MLSIKCQKKNGTPKEIMKMKNVCFFINLPQTINYEDTCVFVRLPPTLNELDLSCFQFSPIYTFERFIKKVGKTVLSNSIVLEAIVLSFMPNHLLTNRLI